MPKWNIGIFELSVKSHHLDTVEVKYGSIKNTSCSEDFGVSK